MSALAINNLRQLIRLRWSGRHALLAKQAGIGLRTLERIMGDPEHLPSFRTYLNLRKAAVDWKRK